jgi:hypothetical protein
MFSISNIEKGNILLIQYIFIKDSPCGTPVIKARLTRGKQTNLLMYGAYLTEEKLNEK